MLVIRSDNKDANNVSMVDTDHRGVYEDQSRVVRRLEDKRGEQHKQVVDQYIAHLNMSLVLVEI